MAVPVLAAARLQRWAVMLSAYHYDIEYKRSTENVCADAMSRLPMLNDSTVPLIAEESPEDQFGVDQVQNLLITAEEISQETEQDKLLRVVVGYILNGWPPDVTDERLKTYWYIWHELTVEQGCLL